MKTSTFVLDVVITLSAVIFIIYFVFESLEKQPDMFDSMLCNIHVPQAAILVTNEIISCTNGFRYRVIK